MKIVFRFYLIIFLIAVISVPSFSRAQSEPINIDEQDQLDQLASAQHVSHSKKKCRKNKRACTVDDAIDQLEGEIENFGDKYENGNAWKAANDIPKDASGGKRAAAYALKVPTYVFRFITWPLAIVGNALVKKGVIRKAVNIVSNKERTRWVYPKLELGFGSGFGGGVGFRQYDIFGKDYMFGAAYQIHVNMNQEFYAKFGTPEAFQLYEKPVGFQIRTDFIKHHNTNYFGLGIQTPESNRAKYGYDMIKVGNWIGYEIFENLTLRGILDFEWNKSRNGDGGISVNAVFPPYQIESFGEDLYYLDMGLSLIHDTRNSDIIPDRGGTRKLTFKRYQGLGTTRFDYNEYNLELIQYIPALMPRHTLILRTEWFYEQQTGEGIPFYKLEKIDIFAPMRAYDYSRWSDRGSAVFNIEYRFPVWKWLDGGLFFDTGRVFHSPADFSFKHFRYDGGVGLRLRTENLFLLRFEFAYGSDGPNFLIKTSQAF